MQLKRVEDWEAVHCQAHTQYCAALVSFDSTVQLWQYTRCTCSDGSTFNFSHSDGTNVHVSSCISCWLIMCHCALQPCTYHGFQQIMCCIACTIKCKLMLNNKLYWYVNRWPISFISVHSTPDWLYTPKHWQSPYAHTDRLCCNYIQKWLFVWNLHM